MRTGLALPLLVLIPSACHFGIDSRQVSIGTVHRTLSGEAIEKFRVNNNVGTIRFVNWSETDLHVEAEVRVKDTRVEEFPTADPSRDLTVEWQDGWAMVKNAHMDDVDRNDWSMDLTVHVPEACEVAHVNTGVGKIEFNGSVRELDLESGVGDVTMRGSAEELRARTGTGSLHVNGQVKRARAEAGTGDIVVVSDALEAGNCESGVGSVTVHAGEGPAGRLEVTTGTGDIELRISPGFDGSVDLSTGVGKLKLEGCSPVKVSKNVTSASAVGSLGQGEAVVHARSGVGSMSLRRL